MRPLDISVDIDGTLLDSRDKDGRRPNKDILDLIWFLAKRTKNVAVHLYSARPLEQQKEIVNRLGLGTYISGYHVKGSGWQPDIHFDDQNDVELGDKNIVVRFK